MALPTATKKAMKKAKVGKVNRVMKAKRVSKIAHGRSARSQVLKGKKEKTVGGLTKDLLMVNKRGKVVSKKVSALGQRRFQRVKGWVDAVMAARVALQVHGFVAINGKNLQGKALYAKARLLAAQKDVPSGDAVPTSASALEAGNA